METSTTPQTTNVKPRLTVEVAELYLLQGQWTEADYFLLPDTNRYLELSEGELLMPPHPTRRHQVAVEECYVQLRNFVRERNLGEVHIAPLPVPLWPGKIREPDVFFMAQEHRKWIDDQVFGPPDLVIEVTSSNTRYTDRVEKSAEYARATIPAYWIIDPEARTVEVFILRTSVYELLEKWSADETAHSALLEGFQIAVDTLFPV